MKRSELRKCVNRYQDIRNQITALEKQKEAEEEAAPEPSNEEKLLAEIRDLLKNQK